MPNMGGGKGSESHTALQLLHQLAGEQYDLHDVVWDVSIDADGRPFGEPLPPPASDTRGGAGGGRITAPSGSGSNSNVETDGQVHYVRGFAISSIAWQELSLTRAQLITYTKCVDKRFPWEKRQRKVFWRGFANGRTYRRAGGGGRAAFRAEGGAGIAEAVEGDVIMPRVRMCTEARAAESSGNLDQALKESVQVDRGSKPVGGEGGKLLDVAEQASTLPQTRMAMAARGVAQLVEPAIGPVRMAAEVRQLQPRSWLVAEAAAFGQRGFWSATASRWMTGPMQRRRSRSTGGATPTGYTSRCCLAQRF